MENLKNSETIEAKAEWQRPMVEAILINKETRNSHGNPGDGGGSTSDAS